MLALVALMLLVSCQLQTPTGFLDTFPPAEITSFSAGGMAATISTDNTIVLDLRWTGKAWPNVVANFTVAAGNVFVNGQTQTSGVTTNNFKTPVAYTVITENNFKRTYTVTIKGGYPFADSGQTNCYDDTANQPCASVLATYPGQDGHHVNTPAVRSFTGPTPHTTFANDYTTTDNVTGLVWRSCSEGQSGAACATGSALTYTLSPDTTTCTALNSANAGAGYAGLTNWRLPIIDELVTLIVHDGASPAIDAAHFPATTALTYWSSNTYVVSPTQAWAVNFTAGSTTFTPKVSAARVRCVSAPAYVRTPPRTDLGDGTIRDDSTNLVWQKCSVGLSNDATCSGTVTNRTWSEALSDCQNLTLAGRSWRLPGTSELGSLIDYSITNPVIDTNLFPSTPLASYWLSTTNSGSPTNAWMQNFSGGTLVPTNAKTLTGRVRCVSGP